MLRDLRWRCKSYGYSVAVWLLQWAIVKASTAWFSWDLLNANISIMSYESYHVCEKTGTLCRPITCMAGHESRNTYSNTLRVAKKPPIDPQNLRIQIPEAVSACELTVTACEKLSECKAGPELQQGTPQTGSLLRRYGSASLLLA